MYPEDLNSLTGHLGFHQHQQDQLNLTANALIHKINIKDSIKVPQEFTLHSLKDMGHQAKDMDHLTLPSNHRVILLIQTMVLQ